MTTRQRNLAVLIVIGLLAAIAGYFGESPHALVRAMDAVPEGSFLVVSIDVARVRSAAVLEELGFVQKQGLDDVTAACGFDPIDRAREAVIAVPEAGEPGDFGLAVVVDLQRDEVVACATKVLTARGGNPTVHDEDGYSIVEDTNLGASRPRIAIRDGSPLFIGHGAWMRQMMGAFDRKTPRPAVTSAHVRLRDELHAQDAAISATAILPTSLRERLRSEVDNGQKTGGPTFSAILQVSEVGVVMRLGQDAGPEGLDAVARCESALACNTLRDFIERKRTVLANDWGVKLIGMATLLESMRMHTQDAELFLDLDAPAAEIARVVNRGWTVTSQTPQPNMSDSGGSPLAKWPDAHTDEVIFARDQ